MKTAKEIYKSNLDNPGDGWSEEEIAISAIQEYAAARCAVLLEELIICKFGYQNIEGVKYSYEWLRDNIT